jgi:hypothetical protein
MEFKGLDKSGNCYFKFDVSNREQPTKVKLRITDETAFEMLLLMRDQLKKFLQNPKFNVMLNSKEKLDFYRLKEALVDDKSLEVKFATKKSIEYNIKHYGKLGAKISEVELKQEEALSELMRKQKIEQKKEYLKISNSKTEKINGHIKYEYDDEAENKYNFNNKKLKKAIKFTFK